MAFSSDEDHDQLDQIGHFDHDLNALYQDMERILFKPVTSRDAKQCFVGHKALAPMYSFDDIVYKSWRRTNKFEKFQKEWKYVSDAQVQLQLNRNIEKYRRYQLRKQRTFKHSHRRDHRHRHSKRHSSSSYKKTVPSTPNSKKTKSVQKIVKVPTSTSNSSHSVKNMVQTGTMPLKSAQNMGSVQIPRGNLNTNLNQVQRNQFGGFANEWKLSAVNSTKWVPHNRQNCGQNGFKTPQNNMNTLNRVKNGFTMGQMAQISAKPHVQSVQQQQQLRYRSSNGFSNGFRNNVVTTPVTKTRRPYITTQPASKSSSPVAQVINGCYYYSPQPPRDKLQGPGGTKVSTKETKVKEKEDTLSPAQTVKKEIASVIVDENSQHSDGSGGNISSLSNNSGSSFSVTDPN